MKRVAFIIVAFLIGFNLTWAAGGFREAADASHFQLASVIRGAIVGHDELQAHGHYVVTDIGPDGKVKWRDNIENVVATVGKNLALDSYLAGSSYTVTGPYIGLISSTSWSAVSASDTMSSHSGWLEAGNAHDPTYSGTRATASWSSASAGTKSLSAAASFSITDTGTVKGCFIVFGSGASSTIDNTSGTLYSAGLFSGGDKTVGNGDTLNVTYSASL